MIHFEPIKCLSYLLITLYVIFLIVSISLDSNNSLIWWQLKIIWSKWEIDVSYVGPEKFFFATFCGSFSLVFWFCVFNHSLWCFSSHGFHILCCLSSISFFSCSYSFYFSFKSFALISFSLLLLFQFVQIWQSSSFLHMLFSESKILEGKGLRFNLVTWGLFSKA